MDGVDREKIEFAYSADCIDENMYSLIETAQQRKLEENIYPVLLIAGSESTETEILQLCKHIPPVITYLGGVSIGSDVSSELSVDDDEDDSDDEDEIWKDGTENS